MERGGVFMGIFPLGGVACIRQISVFFLMSTRMRTG